jgi:hypothetical protein
VLLLGRCDERLGVREAEVGGERLLDGVDDYGSDGGVQAHAVLSARRGSFPANHMADEPLVG